MMTCKENNSPICPVTEADGTMQQSEYVEMLFDETDAIMTLKDAIENRLEDLRGYVFNTLLIGEEVYKDEGFVEIYHCDKDKILRGEALLYAFDLLLFSNREFFGIQKAFFLIDNIDCHGATMKMFGTNSDIFKVDISFTDETDKYLFDKMCEGMHEETYQEIYDKMYEEFDNLLKKVVKDTAENITDADLYI